MSDTEFHIDATIQSQYAASPHIMAVVQAFWDCLNPDADIQSIYDNMVNPDTAVGFGLDVWGRIVAIGREYVAIDENTKYLGFNPTPGVQNPRLDSFNNATFYAVVNGKIRLTDNTYRTYIFIKAMINIGISTLAEINQMLHVMFPDTNICCIHVDTMTLRLVVQGNITEADKTALMNLPWLPAGVQLQLYHVITPTFGFNGSGLMPFNQGTFATYPVIDNQ